MYNVCTSTETETCVILLDRTRWMDYYGEPIFEKLTSLCSRKTPKERKKLFQLVQTVSVFEE